MQNFVVLAQAEEDILGIWDYIASDNPMAATRMVREFYEKFLLLSQNPKLGTLRPAIEPDLRFYPIGNYLVFYREVSKDIEIVRVLHGARNLGALFSADE